jgi:DNA-binding transcriptional MerR regulator
MLSIGQFAKRVGVNVETVRYYERRGLLRKPRQRPSGYRQYEISDVSRMHTIREAKTLGFTLREISSLLVCLEKPQQACTELKHRAELKVAALNKQISQLKSHKAKLERLLAQCASSPCHLKLARERSAT